MKKSLLLAVLLLPCAAQAEIYICDGNVGTVLESGKAYDSLDDADFLINVEEGFKGTGPNKLYRGECQVKLFDDSDNENTTIICTDTTPFAADLIIMDSVSLLFTRSLSFAGSLYAWTGQCSEI